MWITCLDLVSANSEKCIRSQWAVRVGQRLQSRFGKSGAARKLGLVQIIVEASAIRGGHKFPKHLAVLACFFFWLALSQRFEGPVGRYYPSDCMDENICKL